MHDLCHILDLILGVFKEQLFFSYGWTLFLCVILQAHGN